MQDNSVLLTIDGARAWLKERDEAQVEIERLKGVVDEMNRRLAVVDLLLTPEARAALYGSRSERPAEQKYEAPQYIRDYLLKAGGVVSLRDLIADAAQRPEFGARVLRNPNAIYNPVSRLVARGDVIRVGKGLIAREVYDARVAAGEDVMGDHQEAEPGPVIVNRILSRAHPATLSSQEMTAAMKAEPGLRERIERNPQYGYTLLGRMVKRGEIGRNEFGYFQIANGDAED